MGKECECWSTGDRKSCICIVNIPQVFKLFKPGMLSLGRLITENSASAKSADDSVTV